MFGVVRHSLEKGGRSRPEDKGPVRVGEVLFAGPADSLLSIRPAEQGGGRRRNCTGGGRVSGIPARASSSMFRGGCPILPGPARPSSAPHVVFSLPTEKIFAGFVRAGVGAGHVKADPQGTLRRSDQAEHRVRQADLPALNFVRADRSLAVKPSKNKPLCSCHCSHVLLSFCGLVWLAVVPSRCSRARLRCGSQIADRNNKIILALRTVKRKIIFGTHFVNSAINQYFNIVYFHQIFTEVIP